MMNLKLKTLFTLGILTLGTLTTGQAGEQRLVGYANGKPLYVNVNPVVRQARPASNTQHQTYFRAPMRVHVGATQCHYGTGGGGYGGGYSGGGVGYGWGNGGGYYDPGMAYGYGYGNNGYGNNCYGNNQYGHWNQGHNGHQCAAPYVTPYPAAASRGYSWIPRYGASTHVMKYK